MRRNEGGSRVCSGELLSECFLGAATAVRPCRDVPYDANSVSRYLQSKSNGSWFPRVVKQAHHLAEEVESDEDN